MLPLSILKSCRCYHYDDIIFEVDDTVFDINCFSLFLASYLVVDNVGNDGVPDGRTRGLQLAKDANSSGQVSTGLPLLLNNQQQL